MDELNNDFPPDNEYKDYVKDKYSFCKEDEQQKIVEMLKECWAENNA